MHRLRSLLRKEFVQMMRDRRTVVLSVVVPVTLLLLFGLAVSFDLREIRMGVWDRDGSLKSRELVRAFVSSGYFKEVGRPGGSAEAETMLDTGKAAVVLTVPRGFQRDVERAVPAKVQVLLDGTDSSTASVVQGHVRNIVQNFTASLMAASLREQGTKGAGDLLPIDFRPRVFYNPELKSRNFMVPGLIGVLLTMLGVLQTSLAIAKEKDRGTLDQLRVTPLRAREILVGKVLPYALVAFANAWIALGVGRFLLNVPVRGSLWIFTLGTALFLVSALGVGLIISSVTTSQMSAQSLAFLASVLPVFYLSDYMFPLRNMPAWLQAISYVLPARFYVAVLRSTLQKGVGLQEQADALMSLAIYAAVIGLVGIVAIRRALK